MNDTLDDFAAPVSNDVAVPCNDTHEGHYLSEMRHVGKSTVPVIPQPIRHAKSMNPNIYVAALNTENIPLKEENGHETPEDALDYRNDANPYEEKGSHSLSGTTPKGNLFTSTNTDYHDDEKVVMTPLKDANEHPSITFENNSEVTIGKSSQEVSSSYFTQLTSSSVCDQKGPSFSFYTRATPMVTPELGMRLGSTTVAEEEVFEQAVPPTPIETKQLHYSTTDGNQDRRIDDCVQESINVEPVEEKSCESHSSGGKVTEAGMDMPLRSQQQCLDKKEEVLVIPTFKAIRKPVLELDDANHRLYGTATQQ